MSVTREEIMAVLKRITLPGGGDPVSRDLIRALTVEGGQVRFVIEAASPEEARALSPAQPVIETALRALPGVDSVQLVLTAHGPAAKRRARETFGR
jgi:ATP-binding protein involved in chromosome partitioning